MRLYLTAKTAMKDLVIDYIEVNLKKDILRLRPMKGLLDDDEI